MKISSVNSIYIHYIAWRVDRTPAFWGSAFGGLATKPNHLRWSSTLKTFF